ncbi:MAG: TlpA family protein disulfide reductase [Prevotellaceae bacterium]|jgi:peroxiredoxin|nr:TlpA family protein disulfide reductase [Prevotellaceae bacterium]
MKKVAFIFLLLTVAFTSACSRQSAKVEVHIAGAKGAAVQLRKTMMGSTVVLDSARLGASERFSFRIGEVTPASFYQLAVDTMANVSLLVHPGDRIKLSAQAPDVLTTCRVEGSKDMALLLQLQQNMAQGNTALNSLLREANSDDPQRLAEVRKGVARIFLQQKRYNTTFIVMHPSSPASIAAFYQKLGQELPLFGSPDDRFLLRMLTDSLRVRYPKLSYVNNMLIKLDELDAAARLASLQELMSQATEIDKPEVKLSDARGKEHQLSALKGKVVLLDFWLSTSPLCLMDNRELIPLYQKYHAKGFEVFQVSLDDDVEQWKSAVEEHALPWISVSCPASTGCVAAREYRVENIPANFLIDRQGKIAGKDLFGDELAKKVKELMGR